MRLEGFIAKRYLISRHKVNFISIISFISIIGIAIGTAALLVVLSVFNGFSSLVTSLLVNIDPHVKVEYTDFHNTYDDKTIHDAMGTDTTLVKDYSPYVSGKILVYRRGLTAIGNLKGIDSKKGESLYNLESNVRYGFYDIAPDDFTLPGIIMGIKLADDLELIIGDTINIISPNDIQQSITQMSAPQTQSFIVRGIFVSNNNEYDATYLFSDITYASPLLGYFNNPQGIEIKLNDINQSEQVKKDLTNKLDNKLYSVSTWYDLHKELYNVMQIERWAAYMILSLIIAVAVFNILGSLSMSVIEKKRDIGILRTMGVSEKSITRIFMFEGILTGVIGTIAGVILGYFICYLQLKYNIYPLDPTQYKINSLPIEVRVSDFFFVSFASMFLTFLASLYPSKKAAKVNPIEAIKWE